MTIPEFEDYFHGIDLPNTIKLNEATTIENMDVFLETTFMRAKAWQGQPDRNPSLWHLKKLHDILEQGEEEVSE